METLVSWLMVILAALVALPAAVLLLEVLAALVLPEIARRVRPDTDSHRRAAVLIPSHNETIGLVATVTDIKAQLGVGDRLVVIADNCTDDTAAVAAAAGADVVERIDPQHIGKGYALDYGIRHLSDDPPDVVVMIDADCRIAEGAIGHLTRLCAATQRPVQALYLMTAPDGSRINHQVGEFAWLLKNWVRPLGLGALNLPCQLMGAGMAFPWGVIRSASLANGWIVEDLKLGLDLTAAGHRPLFCSSAKVTSQFAASAQGAESQRQRWEQGHIRMILREAPRLLCAAIRHRDLGLLALTLDMAVPPLSLLGLLVVATFTIAGWAALFGFPPAALFVSTASLLGYGLAVSLAWLKYGREILPPRAMFSIPRYVLRKLPLYRRVLSGRMVTRWIRTDRTKPG